MNNISYKAMIKAMEAADHETGKITFSLVYIACDRKRKTGGELRRVERAKKCGLPYHCADHEMRGIVDENGKKTAVHLRLIHEFNGMIVFP